MDIQYITPDEQKEYLSDEGCFILELLNENQLINQSIARARVTPGVTTAWHKLKGTSEIYYILEGQGLAEIGDSITKEMDAHQMIFIPPDTPQRITNTGDNDLVFLCICVPRFQQKNYISI